MKKRVPQFFRPNLKEKLKCDIFDTNDTLQFLRLIYVTRL